MTNRRSLVTFLFFVIASQAALLGAAVARAHDAEARAAMLERIRFSTTRVVCEGDYSADDEAADPEERFDPEIVQRYGLDRL